MPFRITVGDRSYLTDDLSIDEAVDVEKETGHSWQYINPFTSAADCRAIMVAFLTREMSRAEALKTVGAISTGLALRSIKVVSSDLPDEYADGIPKAGAGPATAGSSRAPSDLDGRPT